MIFGILLILVGFLWGFTVGFLSGAHEERRRSRTLVTKATNIIAGARGDMVRMAAAVEGFRAELHSLTTPSRN